MDLWTYGPIDLWTYGPMDLWTYGPMDLWTYGPMDNFGKLGNRETRKPGNREIGKQGNWETGKRGNRETGKRFTISMRTMHCAPAFCCRPRSVATAYSRLTLALPIYSAHQRRDAIYRVRRRNGETIHHFHAHKALCACILLQTPQCGDGL